MDTANYNLDLRGGWKFHLGEFAYVRAMDGDFYHRSSQAGGGLLHLVGFNDENAWQEVSVPHDWFTAQPIDKTEDGTGGCRKRGSAWYKKTFSLPDGLIESANLVFDGVLGQSVVYVNGVIAARNFSGYNRFSCEVADYLIAGEENEIAVYVDARKWEGWWYEGAGIYRPVTLQFRGYTHFLQRECFTRDEERNGEWFACGDLHIVGETDGVSVCFSLTDGKGEEIAYGEQDAKRESLIRLPVRNPEMWSPETPCLYVLTVTLVKDGRVLDTLHRTVGFRKVEWIADKGMYLNGRPYPIKGICCHQDHVGLGAAVTPEVEEYRILRLKTLGANAYRCAHHAPSESLLEICDRLGMLVMSENRHFCASDDVLKQVDDMVCLARNHPSVFIYSMFNEEPWQAQERGKRITERLRKRVRALDPTRAVTAAQNGGMLTRANASDSMDVIGINYNLKHYENCHMRTPDKVMLGTENSPTFATRGVWKTDGERQVFADKGDDYPRFSQPLSQTMDCVKNYPFVAGCFVWSGFDHRGEPNPYEYPSVSSHWGFMDACGFDKNIAYWLRSYYCEKPFVYISFPNAKEGETVEYLAFTNTKRAELFINGKSKGEKSVENGRAVWNCAYETGNVRIVGKSADCEVEQEMLTAEEPVKLLLEDVTPKREKASVKIINIAVVDGNGTLISDCCEVLSITLENGEILGVGNGNPNGIFADKTDCLPLFNGRAQVIVSGNTARLTVSCKGLPTASLGDRK